MVSHFCYRKTCTNTVGCETTAQSEMVRNRKGFGMVMFRIASCSYQPCSEGHPLVEGQD